MRPLKTILLIILCAFFITRAYSQISPCDVVQVLNNPKTPVQWSPDSSKFLVNVQDTAGVFQIYVGNAGDTTLTCISTAYTSGNCCGLFRHWATRNKLQVQWHPSGNYIICGVEKEFYLEVLFVPYYPLRLGWLQCGVWMDIWAVTPDGNNWYDLYNTLHGMTGPAFTPDGSKCAWAEALDTGNLALNKFGSWKLQLADFVVNGAPSFANTTNINPAGSTWIEPGNFAPDGHSLLISSDIGISNAEGQDQFILDINNGNVLNLTNSPMVWDEHGVFSPDGNKILFMSSYPYQSDTNSYHTLSLKTEFMLMNKDGSDVQQLTHYCVGGYIESSGGIAATGFWGKGDSAIYAQSLIFPDYNNWIIKFHGNCGNEITSVSELADNSFAIFPNPAQNTLNIEAPLDLINPQITVINVYGQTEKNIAVVKGDKIQIDVRDLKNGVYFLQVKSDKYQGSRTFLKQE